MAASSLLAIPVWAAAVMAPSFNSAIAFLLVEYLVAECWFGPAVAVLQDNVPAYQRGTAQGLFSVLTTVLPALLCAFTPCIPARRCLGWLTSAFLAARWGILHRCSSEQR